MGPELEVTHCCEMMARELADERVPITFSPKFREYALQLIDESGYTNVYDVIPYCPWCGIELPRSLRDEWFGLVWSQNPDFELFDEPPAGLGDAQWWLKRGL